MKASAEHNDQQVNNIAVQHVVVRSNELNHQDDDELFQFAQLDSRETSDFGVDNNQCESSAYDSSLLGDNNTDLKKLTGNQKLIKLQ